MVELKEITENNYEDIEKLKVASNQENFVSSVVCSLAQAWVYRNTAYPFAIYADDTPVGFIMLGYYELKKQYTLWKFLIDEQYQNMGYGTEALKTAINWLVDNYNVKEVYTGVAFRNTIAESLYYSLGFRKTGMSDKSQVEMKLLIDDFSL